MSKVYRVVQDFLNILYLGLRIYHQRHTVRLGTQTKGKENEMKSNEVSFKKRLCKHLSKRLVYNAQGEVDFNALLGKSATYLDLVLMAQIKKASNGDTSSASFLRDTSGNKLKDKVESEAKALDISPFDLI